jgi:hypothetical protein
MSALTLGDKAQIDWYEKKYAVKIRTNVSFIYGTSVYSTDVMTFDGRSATGRDSNIIFAIRGALRSLGFDVCDG